ncbi:hypothetical protein HER10_EVM0008059 [Colletotrichum scovillei]|uniref:Eukaryotic translation initiation factor 6 n=1 Tax=Colletotrichum scovillei TaxID=1209932 RepID=A0A9P7R780_9PEZI|nr:uncharacterized protein HER10_EVM0008059 [Colletotrichum scovillei]KAF4783269.1 hypothetical protein HER10_EVM0008059 [Colletotrichum scovillei]KAG7051433.1 eukaryotic translation initiation factor 6 [Colletotrichum scovillei]KAG7070470.1 eukaryotic translation initiation factor 6 [Colletotrichum scovillei]KAG7078687.1 eukaryotic translation initiation factor 6 [Colletotrichum scovillei]
MSSQRPDPSQRTQRHDDDEDDDGYPPLPPHRRLPPLPPISRDTSRLTFSSNTTRRHPWEPEPYTTQDQAETYYQLTRHMADRNFQAEYDELVGNSLSGFTTFMSQAQDDFGFSRNNNLGWSQNSNLLNILQNDQNDQRDDDDNTRRQPLQLPPVFGYRTTRTISGRQRTDGTEDDLEAVRALWNRRAQYSSSPFSPPRMPPNQSPPNLSPLPPSEECPEESRRVKRRKLDSERIAQSFKGFRYGRYGQVESGQLKMEIMSCDGGLYENATLHAHENILKDDKTVYCTQSNRCNIILRHQGGTAFSLKELVIKAPASNYSSPVREGMIFVSMNQDELLRRTAEYEIQYAPHRSGRTTASRALAPIISIRHHEDGTTVTRTHSRQRRLYSLGHDDDENESRTAQIPPEFITHLPPFNITTECSYEETDDDDTPRITANRTAPNRIGSLPFESDSSDDGNPFASDFEDYSFTNRRRDPNDMSLAEAVEANQMATQEAVRAVSGGRGLMAPHAKFFIEKDKSKCTIRFDPPVAGRFILLKMWSSSRAAGSNIDIQAVLAKGFAGPRYFPSVELR